MRGISMKRILLPSLGIALVAVAFFSSNAFPWGSATHTFINDHLGKKDRLANINEMYGGTGMDVFNSLFLNQSPSITVHSEFMKVWNEAKLQTEKALAFGFISHNEIWGADFTAHRKSITSDRDEGYIITKSYLLKEILEQNAGYGELNLADDMALAFAHYCLERGIDILIKRQDPCIGRKMIFSAKNRSSNFPLLLIKAYAQDFTVYYGSYPEAAMGIFSAEEQFRKTIVIYGLALAQTEDLAIQLVAEQMARQSERFFAAHGIEIPATVDMVSLMKFALEKSIGICAEDYYQEISATISFLEQQLDAHGISYDN
ncbi:MAG: hypothetical protein AB1611_20390 [bacterium]